MKSVKLALATTALLSTVGGQALAATAGVTVTVVAQASTVVPGTTAGPSGPPRTPPTRPPRIPPSRS